LDFLKAELERWEESGAIRPATTERYISKVFMVPKPGVNKWRICWDGRHVNSFCRPMTVSFETLKSLRHLAQQGDWMVSMDLTDGFHAVGIHEDHQAYLSFQALGRTYSFQVLPFGWSGSPAVFCRVMETLTRALRSPDVPTRHGQATSLLRALHQAETVRVRALSPLSKRLEQRTPPLPRVQGRGSETAVQLPPMRVLPYMDDYLAVFSSREEAFQGVARIKATLAWLGLDANEKKCHWEPTQRLRHLGLEVDTQRGLFLVPPDKETKISQFARVLKVEALAQRRLCPARRLAQFVGLAQSVSLAVPAARLFLRSLHDSLSTKESWNSNVRLGRQALRDLQWWIDLPRQPQGRVIWRTPDQAVLWSDSSGFAWGGKLQDCPVLAHGIWTATEAQNHITTLELLAVLRNLQAFSRHLMGKQIQLFEDNQAVVSILRNYTSRAGPVMMDIVRRLFAFMERNDMSFGRIDYVKSADNPADAPSRKYGSDEWKLKPSVFLRLDKRFGPHTVDRFCSEDNNLCPRYNSEFVDQSAEAVNAFTQYWNGENNWIHPPISALNEVALKLRLDQAAATVIAPLWVSKPWFVALRQMSSSITPLGKASALADPAYLHRFGLRGPSPWQLAAFRVRADLASYHAQ